MGQPRISERKSWRAPIVTEQGNPGIYVQIDEWLPLYKGNVYVVDEITGRMYLSKGEQLMRIAETASHHPFQDHELSVSRHIPEREYPRQEDQQVGEEAEATPRGEEEGAIDPITPIAGAAGGMGRTPIPVAESMHQPGEEAFTPSEIPVKKEPDQGGMPPGSSQNQDRTEGDPQDGQRGGESGWALPKPSEPREPPGGGTEVREVSPQADRIEGGETHEQESLSPEQCIVKADKR